MQGTALPSRPPQGLRSGKGQPQVPRLADHELSESVLSLDRPAQEDSSTSVRRCCSICCRARHGLCAQSSTTCIVGSGEMVTGAARGITAQAAALIMPMKRTDHPRRSLLAVQSPDTASLWSWSGTGPALACNGSADLLPLTASGHSSRANKLGCRRPPLTLRSLRCIPSNPLPVDHHRDRIGRLRTNLRRYNNGLDRHLHPRRKRRLHRRHQDPHPQRQGGHQALRPRQ